MVQCRKDEWKVIFFKQKVFICRFAFLGAESFESKRKKDLLALLAQFTSRAADTQRDELRRGRE